MDVTESVTVDELRGFLIDRRLEGISELCTEGIADGLGATPGSVTDALILVEQDGLVTLEAGGTVRIGRVDLERVIETLEFREVVEGLAARLAAQRQLPVDIRQRMSAQMAVMCATSSLDRYRGAHAEFHLALLEAAGSARLGSHSPLVTLTSLGLVLRQGAESGRLLSDTATRRMMQHANEDHQALMFSIRRGNLADSQELAQRHIRRTTNLARRVMSRGRTARGLGCVPTPA
jgi:GntR family transcriptional regulator, vanillate catabolism transcriptional regulator